MNDDSPSTGRKDSAPRVLDFWWALGGVKNRKRRRKRGPSTFFFLRSWLLPAGFPAFPVGGVAKTKAFPVGGGHAEVLTGRSPVYLEAHDMG